MLSIQPKKLRCSVFAKVVVPNKKRRKVIVVEINIIIITNNFVNKTYLKITESTFKCV